MGRYISDPDDRAAEMFERLIGRSYAVTTYEEVLEFKKDKGSQVQLAKEPIDIESCQGYLEYDQLRFKGWVDVPVSDLTVVDRGIDVPPSLFGVRYSKVKIGYTSGHATIPKDIQAAVQEINDVMDNPNVTTWNLPLSHSTLETIEKYRERG